MIDVDRRQRRVPSPLPPPAPAASHDDVVLVATRLATVEQQLSSYFSSIATQANATRLAAESARHEARADLEALATSVRAAIEQLTSQSADDRRALRLALDARLADIGSHQDWRFAELEARLDRVAQDAGAVDNNGAAATGGPTSAEIDQHLAGALGPVAARVEALGTEVTRVAEEMRRIDTNGAALHQYVSRMKGLVEATAAETVDARLVELRAQIGSSLDALKGDVDTSIAAQRNAVEIALADVHAQVATGQAGVEAATDRLADLDTQVAALRGGVDQTLAALSARMTEMQDAHSAATDRLARVEQATAKVDAKEIDHLREKMQTAVGEAVLMRIEMDRLSGSLDERFDSVRVRLSEVESQVADNMDISTAVQLERLEELERAVLFLTPTDAPEARAFAAAQASRAARPAAPVARFDGGPDAVTGSPVAPAPAIIPAPPMGTAVPPPPGAPVAPASDPSAPTASVPTPALAAAGATTISIPASPMSTAVPPPPGVAMPTASTVPPPPPAASVPPPPPTSTPAPTDLDGSTLAASR
jgi:predicted  nucleic acid-binding Zn-ribbon protein